MHNTILFLWLVGYMKPYVCNIDYPVVHYLKKYLNYLVTTN